MSLCTLLAVPIHLGQGNSANLEKWQMKLCVGPNTDTRLAIDWKAFAYDFAIYRGQPGRLSRQQISNTRLEMEAASNLINKESMTNLVIGAAGFIAALWRENVAVGFKGSYVQGGKLMPLTMVEGFLLFLEDLPQHQSESLMRSCDAKIFLQAKKEQAKKQRFQRHEYMDPPQGTRLPSESWKREDYFERIAWPEYKSEHGWIFKNRDVETDFNVDPKYPYVPVSDKAKRMGIVCISIDQEFEKVVCLAVSKILNTVKAKVGIRSIQRLYNMLTGI
jgi:hypothetical protein